MTPEDVVRAITNLTKTLVMVGIPSEASPRDSGQITNATLGYIHEMGSPANNVPARPFLAPGVANSRPEWEKHLRQAADAAFEGNEGAMTRALEAAGTVAADAVKQVINDRIPPPLKPATIMARARYRKGTPRQRRAQLAPGGATPLIDTAQLLNSITYVLRKI